MGKDWTEQFLDDTSAWKRRAGFKCVEALGGIIIIIMSSEICLQCFDAVGWAAGRASGL